MATIGDDPILYVKVGDYPPNSFNTFTTCWPPVIRSPLRRYTRRESVLKERNRHAVR